ncbi:MAG: Asp-tRNA(Asn)/Glu-tRNA(Gln) amidotransferase subunit GatB [Deltaproteobacteria bacterium]|nr:Asp-tRNA(Asn)/Glu-tRNA(Gln) amidotransferase subunit GatB [Deltaproteobacteria bacterium]MCL5791563.1 Asp-tRNA(Asn)/Glu-tRNA(Gln) amidotransferase subunit GatB [Deltaproteobacteria bacterium]
MEYEAVIGLEIHAQLKTETKAFCSCSTTFALDPNINVCPVCLGLPGALPVLNEKVVLYACMLAMSVSGEISKRSVFARKNYFYPDLPKGYQISQYELPISRHGVIHVQVNNENRAINLNRIHIEEDAGKLMHNQDGTSFVDFNRSGVPLLEIVSEPDMTSPDEAVAYLKKLRTILIYLGICDGNMEEGSLRCDANISVRPKGTSTLGVKAELKNMNSFRFIHKALTYEIQRQIDVIEEGGTIIQETRLWDEGTSTTMPMRSKEEAHDYRYFPEPDLLTLELNEEILKRAKESIPELPDMKMKRFTADYNLPSYDADVLTAAKDLANYFEGVVKLFNKPKVISNWIMSEMLRFIKDIDTEIKDFKVKPEQTAELLELIDNGTISGKIAKTIYEKMVETAKSPDTLVKELGLEQVSDQSIIMDVVKSVIEKQPKEVEQYKAGKGKLIGFFVGQVMKATNGKANPGMVNEILTKLLKGS